MIIDFYNNNGGGGGSYTLPTATANRLGGVKVGSGLTVENDGTLNVSGGTYELPVATDQVLGGVKVGSGLSIDSGGTISAQGGDLTKLMAVGELPATAETGTVMALTGQTGQGLPYGITYEEMYFGGRFSFPTGLSSNYQEPTRIFLGKAKAEGGAFGDMEPTDLNVGVDPEYPNILTFTFEDPNDPLLDIYMGEDTPGTNASEGICFEYRISGDTYIIDIYVDENEGTEAVAISDVPHVETTVGTYQYNGEEWEKLSGGKTPIILEEHYDDPTWTAIYNAVAQSAVTMGVEEFAKKYDIYLIRSDGGFYQAVGYAIQEGEDDGVTTNWLKFYTFDNGGYTYWLLSTGNRGIGAIGGFDNNIQRPKSAWITIDTSGNVIGNETNIEQVDDGLAQYPDHGTEYAFSMYLCCLVSDAERYRGNLQNYRKNYNGVGGNHFFRFVIDIDGTEYEAEYYYNSSTGEIVKIVFQTYKAYLQGVLNS